MSLCCWLCVLSLCVHYFFFLMIRRPPRSTRTTHSFPTRRSSDLPRRCDRPMRLVDGANAQRTKRHVIFQNVALDRWRIAVLAFESIVEEIGRASCRERVCQYV